MNERIRIHGYPFTVVGHDDDNIEITSVTLGIPIKLSCPLAVNLAKDILTAAYAVSSGRTPMVPSSAHPDKRGEGGQ